LLPPEECRVFIRDHHEAYISWQEFEENRRRLQSNALRLGSDASVAVIRQGHGLLSGLLVVKRGVRNLSPIKQRREQHRAGAVAGEIVRVECDGSEPGKRPEYG